MKKWTGRSTVFPTQVAFAGFLIIIAAIFIGGCGFIGKFNVFSRSGKETKQLYKGLEDSKGSLKKILAVLPFENSEQWSRVDLETPLVKELKHSIEKKCRHIRVILPDSPGFPAQFEQLQRQENGGIDNYAVALAGRASGINMVLSDRLISIRYITETKGMLWWKKPRHLARIQMEFAVFHTGTGAKLFDETVIKDIEIKESEGLRIKENEMPDTVPLTEAIADISKTIGEIGDTVFGYIPWEGYVTDADGDRIVLSSGGSIGLKEGKTLDVFSANKVTRGKSGRFMMEGSKIGSITLTSIFPDRSEAVLEEGGPIPPGSAVRLP